MKTYILKINILVFTLFALIPAFFLIPVVSFAQTNTTITNTSLVYQCDGTASSTDASGTPPCDFNALINTGTHLVEWMFYIAIPVMVALLAYSGILYMTGIEKNISKAKSMFISVALGFSIMLVAFVFIDTLVGWISNSQFTTTSSGAASNPAVFLQNN